MHLFLTETSPPTTRLWIHHQPGQAEQQTNSDSRLEAMHGVSCIQTCMTASTTMCLPPPKQCCVSMTRRKPRRRRIIPTGIPARKRTRVPPRGLQTPRITTGEHLQPTHHLKLAKLSLPGFALIFYASSGRSRRSAQNPARKGKTRTPDLSKRDTGRVTLSTRCEAM